METFPLYSGQNSKLQVLRQAPRGSIRNVNRNYVYCPRINDVYYPQINARLTQMFYWSPLLSRTSINSFSKISMACMAPSRSQKSFVVSYALLSLLKKNT